MYPSVSTKTMRSYLLQTFALTILVGGVLGWIYFSIFPEHYFQGYPALPVFFFLLGVGTVGLMEKWGKTMPQKITLMYLLARRGRTILSLVFLLVYCITAREEAFRFALAFVVFYMIYLIFDTWFFGVKGNKKIDKI